MGKDLGSALSIASRDKTCSVWGAVLDALNSGLDTEREKTMSRRLVIETHPNQAQKQTEELLTEQQWAARHQRPGIYRCGVPDGERLVDGTKICKGFIVETFSNLLSSMIEVNNV